MCPCCCQAIQVQEIKFIMASAVLNHGGLLCAWFVVPHLRREALVDSEVYDEIMQEWWKRYQAGFNQGNNSEATRPHEGICGVQFGSAQGRVCERQQTCVDCRLHKCHWRWDVWRCETPVAPEHRRRSADGNGHSPDSTEPGKELMMAVPKPAEPGEVLSECQCVLRLDAR